MLLKSKKSALEAKGIKYSVFSKYSDGEAYDLMIITNVMDPSFSYWKFDEYKNNSLTKNYCLLKAQLEDALDRASLLSRIDKNNLVKFDITDKLMMLSSKSDIGDIKENITVALNGKDLTIAFNARYLSDCMHTISDEFIKINFSSQIAPCTICSAEEDKYLYLILPVRIVE